MLTIATLLDPISDQAVRLLWSRLEASCGLTGVQSVPLPHFSWQGGEAYQMDALESVLSRLAQDMVPFRVRATGLGIFTGQRPVVYIPLVKDQNMMDLHRRLWVKLSQYVVVPNPYYDPFQWVPHITLALHEVETRRLACAVEEMARQPIEFDILVNNLSVLYRTNGSAGIQSRFIFNQDILQYGSPK